MYPQITLFCKLLQCIGLINKLSILYICFDLKYFIKKQGFWEDFMRFLAILALLIGGAEAKPSKKDKEYVAAKEAIEKNFDQIALEVGKEQARRINKIVKDRIKAGFSEEEARRKIFRESNKDQESYLKLVLEMEKGFKLIEKDVSASKDNKFKAWYKEMLADITRLKDETFFINDVVGWQSKLFMTAFKIQSLSSLSQ